MATLNLTSEDLQNSSRITVQSNNESLKFNFDTDSAVFSREGDNLHISSEDGNKSMVLEGFYNAYSDSTPKLFLGEEEVDFKDFFTSIDKSLLPAAGNQEQADGNRFYDLETDELDEGIEALDGILGGSNYDVSPNLSKGVGDTNYEPKITLNSLAIDKLTDFILLTSDSKTLENNTDSDSFNLREAILDNTVVDWGADSSGTIEVDAFALEILNPNTGLTSQGKEVLLSSDPNNNIEGKLEDGTLVFTLSVNDDGEVIFTQHQHIDHISNDENNNDDLISFPDNLIAINANITAKDGDGSEAQEEISIDLGGNIIIADDTPLIENQDFMSDNLEAMTANLSDEEVLDGGSSQQIISFGKHLEISDANTSPAWQYSHNADSADSASATYNYELALDNSVEHSLASNGQALEFVQEGNTIYGHVNNERVISFELNPENGDVTVTQHKVLDHLDSNQHNEIHTLPQQLIQLNATLNVVDSDNDNVSSTVNIDFANTVNFSDDGPRFINLNIDDSETILNTSDAELSSDSADFSNLFYALNNEDSVDFGADGMQSFNVSDYALNILNTETGLTSGDIPITLENVDGKILAKADDKLIFEVEVNQNGSLSVKQHAPLDHAINSDSLSLPDNVLELKANITATDGDNDTVSKTAAIDLGNNINFADDKPQFIQTEVDSVQRIVLQDSETIGDSSDNQSYNFSSLFENFALADFGEDGVGSLEVNQYSLQLTSSNSKLTHDGEPIILSKINGKVYAEADGELIFEVSVDKEGNLTVVQHESIDHQIGSDSIALAPDVLKLVGRVEITDSDNDSVQNNISMDLGNNIVFTDDKPEVIGQDVDTNIKLLTDDKDTINDDFDTASRNMSSYFLSQKLAKFNADGAGSLEASDYNFTIENENSGLTSKGEDIILSLENGVVFGKVGDTIIFEVKVEDDGTVTLIQRESIDHAPNSSRVLLDNNVIKLNATVTATDSDGDFHSSKISMDLGNNIGFRDSTPSVAKTEIDGDILAMTDDSETAGSEISSDTQDFSPIFTDDSIANYNADWQGNVTAESYNLSIINADTGLTSGGEAVRLIFVNNMIIGQANNETVFEVHVDENTGHVTLKQFKALDHLEGSDVIVLPDNLIQLNAVATITDVDSDSTRTNVRMDMGGNLAFKDDTVEITKNVTDGNIKVTTLDSETVGTESNSSSANFKGYFTSKNLTDFGEDKAANTEAEDFNFTILDENSGLTSQGVEILLSMEGDTVIGKAGDKKIFEVEVDANGKVTLTQYDSIDHADGQDEIALPNEKLQLNAQVTAYDKDGDSDSENVTMDLGENISFTDSYPRIAENKVDSDERITIEDDINYRAEPQGESIDYSELFIQNALANYGADKEGDISADGYTLTVLNPNSSLTSRGNEIKLALVDGKVIGQTDEEVVFEISVNENGLVTITQKDIIDHGNDALELLLPDNLIQLGATVAVTDSDNDTVLQNVSMDLGNNIKFGNDTNDYPHNEYILRTDDEDTIGSDSDSHNFQDLFVSTSLEQAGLNPSTAINGMQYSLSVNETDSGLTHKGEAIILSEKNGNIIGSAGGKEVFEVKVSGDGTITLIQHESIDHPEGAREISLDSDLITLNGVALGRNDEGKTESVEGELNIGSYIRFDDDTPSLQQTQVDSSSILNTKESDINSVQESSVNHNFSELFDNHNFADFGADGEGFYTITGYDLRIMESDTGLTSLGEPITLTLVGNKIVASALNKVIFEVEVDNNGNVTLTQKGAIDHPTDLDTLNLPDGLIQLNASVNIGDTDNDIQNNALTMDLGNNLSFDDNAPKILLTEVDSSKVILTKDSDTIEGGVSTSSQDMSSVFTNSNLVDFGIDGEASFDAGNYKLVLLDENSNLSSGGNPIILKLEGNTIVGEVSGQDGVSKAFEVSVNSQGVVTVKQFMSIDHAENSDYISLGNNIIGLEANITASDTDNDSINDVVRMDLGNNIAFADDAPSVEASVVDSDISIITQDSGTDIASNSTSFNFSETFTSSELVDFGADNAGNIQAFDYIFRVRNPNTGMTSEGTPIKLSLVDNKVVGQAGSKVVFEIEVDEDGTVNLEQFGTIDHAVGSDIAYLPNDLVELNVRVNAKDSDNDEALGSLRMDLGGNIAFADSKPLEDNTYSEGIQSEVSVQESEQGIIQKVVGNFNESTFASTESLRYAGFDEDYHNQSISLSKGMTALLVVEAGGKVLSAISSDNTTLFSVTINNDSWEYVQYERFEFALDTSIVRFSSDGTQELAINFNLIDRDYDTSTIELRMPQPLEHLPPSVKSDLTEITENDSFVKGQLFANDTVSSEDNTPLSSEDADVVSISSEGVEGVENNGLIRVEGKYGTLLIYQETGEYMYEYDENNPDLVALFNGESESDVLTENFEYTLSNGEDSVSSSLSIVIRDIPTEIPNAEEIQANDAAFMIADNLQDTETIVENIKESKAVFKTNENLDMTLVKSEDLDAEENSEQDNTNDDSLDLATIGDLVLASSAPSLASTEGEQTNMEILIEQNEFTQIKI